MRPLSSPPASCGIGTAFEFRPSKLLPSDCRGARRLRYKHLHGWCNHIVWNKIPRQVFGPLLSIAEPLLAIRIRPTQADIVRWVRRLLIGQDGLCAPQTNAQLNRSADTDTGTDANTGRTRTRTALGELRGRTALTKATIKNEMVRGATGPKKIPLTQRLHLQINEVTIDSAPRVMQGAFRSP